VDWGAFDVEPVVIIGVSSAQRKNRHRKNGFNYRNLGFYRSPYHRRYGGFDIQLLSRQAQKAGTNKGE